MYRKALISMIACFSMAISQGAAGEVFAAGPVSGEVIDCVIQRGPCTRALGNTTVTLDILPRPVKAMRDLKFQVTLSGGRATATPYIDLGMPGMEMGPNRVELRPVKDNVYEGQGIIVQCPSGRTIWRAAVTIPGVGKVEFIFDVLT